MTIPIDWVAMIPDITWQKVANFLLNLGITGVVFWGAIEFIAKKTIDFKVTQKVQEHKGKMDKQLETYKSNLQHDMKIHEQNLQVLTEQAKYRFNCLSQDYNMYRKERYNSYVNIRKKLLDAMSYTLGLRGFGQIEDFTKLSKEEVVDWLDERKFGKFHRKMY